MHKSRQLTWGDHVVIAEGRATTQPKTAVSTIVEYGSSMTTLSLLAKAHRVHKDFPSAPTIRMAK